MNQARMSLLIVLPMALVGCGSTESSDEPNVRTRSERDAAVNAQRVPVEEIRRQWTQLNRPAVKVGEPLTDDELQTAANEVDRFHAAVAQRGGRAQLDIDFSRSDIRDEDLANMIIPATVRSINLAHTSIGDASLDRLSQLKSLERLVLVSTKVTDAGIEQLLSLPNLAHVDLEYTQVSHKMKMVLLKHTAQRQREQLRLQSARDR